MKKILILTSGGDAPGMNAAIRAVVRMGHHQHLNVYATSMGYQGLVEENIFPMQPDSVANIIQRGGTLLKTGRCEAFKDRALRKKVLSFLKKEQIDGMIVMGGDGSFRGAALLASEGGPAVIGIPCTIDNDIVGTDYTLGFDTARNTALQAIDNIRDTAASHNRNFLVEVMGNQSGFLAVEVGIAGGAEFILIPEIALSIEQLIACIEQPRRKKLGSIIVVAEAGNPGRSLLIAQALKKKANLEYRVCVLGHTQRGGSPTAWDRKVASLMGVRAVEALLAGETQKMIARQDAKYCLANFPDPAHVGRRYSKTELLHLNSILCE